jgi:hypothetical protein
MFEWLMKQTAKNNKALAEVSKGAKNPGESSTSQTRDK